MLTRTLEKNVYKYIEGRLEEKSFFSKKALIKKTSTITVPLKELNCCQIFIEILYVFRSLFGHF